MIRASRAAPARAALVLAIALLAAGPVLAAGEAPPATATAAEAAEAAEGDVLSRARALATSDQRPEAIALLRAHLEAHPEDSDARVLLGIVLSWQGDYPAARKELEQVLDGRPDHGDALPALIRVELWSGNALRAEELARNALLGHPDDTTLLVLHAQAQRTLRRDSDALADLERALRIDPGDTLARDLRDAILDSRRLWTARLYYTLDLFDKQREPWNEVSVSLKRDTQYGPVLVKYWHAVRFDTHSDQFEIEAYPRIRPGTYLFLQAGFSPDAGLYPTYRAAGDVYQALPWSFEISAGYRRLGFDDPVDIYTGALAKYLGDWLLWSRLYLTPDEIGTSVSFQVGFRRYFGEGVDWVGLRYGHGTGPELITLGEVELLDSDTVLFEAVKTLGPHWEVGVEAGYARDEQLSGDLLSRFTLGLGLSYRF